MPWTFMAWSHAPDSDYGVVTVADQEALKADADAIAEKILTGYVDLFTSDQTADSMDAIETVLRGMGLWFRLESIQFEEDTGYIHYEWTWADTNGSAKANIAQIRFVTPDSTTEEWMPYGATPTAPTGVVSLYQRISPGQNNGLWYCPSGWDSPITPVSGNKTYNMQYVIGVELSIQGDEWICKNYAENSQITNGYPITGTPFTAQSLNRLRILYTHGWEVYQTTSSGKTRKMIELNQSTAVFVSDDGTEISAILEIE